MPFFSQIERRNVIGMGALYIVVALAISFVSALIFASAFGLAPERLKLESSV